MNVDICKTHRHNHAMVLFNGSAAAEECHDEDNDAHQDQYDRAWCVELLVSQIHVRWGVHFSPDAYDQDYQARDLWKIENVNWYC